MRRRCPVLVVPLLMLMSATLAGCSGGEGRAAPKPGEQVVVASFEDGFLPRGIAVDGAGTVYTSGWDGERFVIAAFPEKGEPTRRPIPCATGEGPDNEYFFALVAAPDATLYWAAGPQHRVVRIEADGGGGCFAGTGAPGSAGDGGPATAAQLTGPFALALDAGRGELFITEQGGPVGVRKVDAAGVITTFLQQTSLSGDIPGAGPASVVFDSARDVLYVGDVAAIFAVDRDGRGTAIASTGPELRNMSLAVDPSGDGLVVGRFNPDCDVVHLELDGQVTPLPGSKVGPGCPDAIAIDRRGDVWFVVGDDLIVVGAGDAG